MANWVVLSPSSQPRTSEHGRTLAQHGRTLAEHGRKLDGIIGRLDTLETGINQGFAEILRRLDNNPPSD